MDAAYNLMHVMSLAPGVRLGPYEIVALIGAGGMGKFYAVRIPESGPVTSDVFSSSRVLREQWIVPAVACRRHVDASATDDTPGTAAIFP